MLYLPLSAAGRFYSTAHRGAKGRDHVYLMAHILRTQRLPATVRLICGYMPRVPCNFTGGEATVRLICGYKNDEISKIDDPGIVLRGFDLAESNYVV